jgi:hypothetical protein
MDTIATKNDHESQPGSWHGQAEALRDREAEQSLSVLPNKRHCSNNAIEIKELNMATTLRPLSGWRLTAVAFA